MKIVIHLHRLFAGGIERSMGNLAHGLTARGHGVRLLMNRTGFADALRFFPEGTDVHLTGAKSVPGRVWGARRNLRAQPADCVLASQHVNCELSVVACRLAGTPCIPIEHTHWSTALPELRRLSPRRLSHRVAGWVYPWAAARAAVSAGVADDYARLSGLPRDRFDVMYNPVVSGADLEAWRSPGGGAGAPGGGELHRFFREPGGPVIVGMGRVNAQKNFALLLDAFARLGHRPAPRLVVFGIGPDRGALQAQAEALGVADRFDLAGFTPDALAHLRAADLFALSSRYEGLPTVLIESLAVGTPVVSTRCPSGPEEILRGGDFGRLVPVGEVAPLAEAMDAALAEAADDPPPPAPLEYLRRFSVEEVAQDYERLIERATAGR